MKPLQIIYAPDPIFKKEAEIVEKIDDEIKKIIEQMIVTMKFEGAIGLGANMVGILKRIIVLMNQQGTESFAMVNPEIIHKSKELQEFEESSISFPGISAKIERPKRIIVNYLDYYGEKQTLEAEDLLSTVIQHEIDYLNGQTFLDHLSKMKRDRLIIKMQKHLKHNPPHIHGEGCSH